MKKKLVLINPVGQKSGFLMNSYTTFPPLSLAYIAALTPSDWEVKIIDENFDKFEEKFIEADLVGITAFTSTINRAYEISKQLRDKKIPVVMGGIHPSMIPDESKNYTDSVVVGEAEGVWGKVIKDFNRKQLQSVYIGQQVDLFKTNIMPRRELLHSGYIWNTIQTSRGCPFNCKFCSVTKYLGKEYRQRCADNVIRELKAIKGRYVGFLDDNLIGYSTESLNRAGKIFNGMIENNLKKRWFMQTSINAVQNEEIIKLAGKAGCMFAFIGFETLDKKSLKSIHKGINIKFGIENYRKVVEIFHKAGIAVFGSFVIGNDYESMDYYEKLADFLLRTGVDIFQCSILTPLPGTEFFEQMKKNDKLIYKNFPGDWDKYRLSYLVHKPKGVSPETVYTGNNYIKKKTYSFPIMQYRALRTLFTVRNPANVYIAYKFNKAFKKGWQNTHYYET